MATVPELWLACACIVVVGLALAAPGPGGGRRVARLSRGWRFLKGACRGAEASAFDDSAWQPVRVPHDWAIAGPFDPEQAGRTAKLPWRGEGWYRTTLALAEAERGRRVYLDFDGVMAFPKVYVNGQLAGQWDYGYASFRVDATPFVRFGADNAVAVHADTRQHGSRWYPGAGLYRKVVATVCDAVHVEHWGTWVTTPMVSDRAATVRVRTTVASHLADAADVTVETVIVAPDGATAGQASRRGAVAAGGSREFDQAIEVGAPQRWGVASPRLYVARTVVRRGGAACDAVETRFGIRTVAWTADDGFHLNGRRVQLQGVDLHHGHGPLGAAFYRRAMERQLEILKDMGVNALRTSHNPPSPEALELCDAMGIVVLDEAFDKWSGTAGLLDEGQFEPFMDRQVRSLVRRDRNHPCVVIWSIGNEIGHIETNRDGDAPAKVAFMVEAFKRHDPTRAVTFGCLVPDAVRDDAHVLDPLDVTSWNYGRKYLPARARYPDKPILYSESASALSTRGFYELPLPTEKTDYSDQLQVDSYDLNAASGPRDIPDHDFLRMEADRYVAGELVWTGFDYLGEPTPFAQEARSSYFGIVDLCGIPKDRYYLYRSHWAPDAATVHIVPHWNWPERVGQAVPVFVYTNGDTAELFLNGQSLGRRSKLAGAPDADGAAEAPYYAVVDRYRLRWMDVAYQPGELRAVAYRRGERIGEAVVRTAGEPASLRLTADRASLAATGDDLCYVLVEALDAEGVPCPLADSLVRFDVEGSAVIAGVGNGNPLSLEPFQADRRQLFFGKAMLIVRPTEGPGGTVRLLAASAGLCDGRATLTVHR